MNAYDTFLVDEIFPAIMKSLKTEDARFREVIRNSKHKKFYEEDKPDISHYIFTERTLQFFIFRDLCKCFKLFPEDQVFEKSKKRMDLSIYKNISDPTKPSEIGIEIKKMYFKRNGELYSVTVKSIVQDFDKLKQASNQNKYILLFGIDKKAKIDQEKLEDQFQNFIDKRKLKKFRLKILHHSFFKSEGTQGKNYYHAMLWKLYEFQHH